MGFSRWAIALALVNAGCASGTDLATQAILEKYRMPMGLASACRVDGAKVGSPVKLRGEIFLGTEEIPNFFVASETSQLPPEGLVRPMSLAYKKGTTIEARDIYNIPVIVSGRIVTGEITCRGNFYSETQMGAWLLLDEVTPGAQ